MLNIEDRPVISSCANVDIGHRFMMSKLAFSPSSAFHNVKARFIMSSWTLRCHLNSGIISGYNFYFMLGMLIYKFRRRKNIANFRLSLCDVYNSSSLVTLVIIWRRLFVIRFPKFQSRCSIEILFLQKSGATGSQLYIGQWTRGPLSRQFR